MHVSHNATLFFARDNQVSLQGQITEYGELTIYYDPFRLRYVYEDEKSGTRTGMIYCEYQFDNGEITSLPVTQKHQASGGPVGRVTPLAVTIDVPPECNLISIWFRGTRAAYKESFDSNMGDNYNFNIYSADTTL